MAIEIPSSFYDIEYYLGMEWRYLSGAHARKIEVFKNTLGDVGGKRVLDLGCGGGFFSYLASIAHAKVIGVDYSEAAITFAKDRYPDIDFRVGNAKTLQEFPSHSFDVVLLMDVIEHIHDQDTALREIRRVLVPGGKVIISTDIDDSPWNSNRYSWWVWQTYRFSQSGRAYRLIKKVEERRKAVRNYHASHVAMRSVAELSILLERHGFENVQSIIYALVRVPIRDIVCRLLPRRFRGDHVIISASSIR